MALVASTPGKQMLVVTLVSPVSPDFGMAVFSEISVLCWVQEKSLIFSLLSFLLVVRIIRATTSKLFTR